MTPAGGFPRTWLATGGVGHLVHGHRVVVLPCGGDVLEQGQMLKQVLELAVEVTRRDANGLRAIEVHDDELEPGVAYKVDLKSQRMKRLDTDDAWA